LRVRSAGKDDVDSIRGVLLDKERVKAIAPALNHSLEQMRILEDIDLMKELEPSSFFFAVGRRASRH
jgi:hypothetical protein